MKTKSFMYMLIPLVAGVGACNEGSRFESAANDATPPGPPTNISWKPLNGGARFYYTVPDDEDLISVDAEYTNAKGKTFHFTASYYTDSLDVIGFGSTSPQTVRIFGVDRARNRSTAVEETVIPLEPAVTRVAETLALKPGFSAFFVDWTNELKQVVNVYVHYKYADNGTPRNLVTVFSSNQEKDRKFINNLYLTPDVPIEVTLRVEDRYENSTDEISFGTIYLQEDFKLDKSIWKIPDAADSTVVIRDGTRINTGVPAMFGDAKEGRMEKLKDGIIDRGDNLNFFHTDGRGRNGRSGIANQNDWNIIIDLGDYYRLSRIVTHQRHSGGLDNVSQGQYYKNENCGEFRLYVFNEQILRWDTISQQKIPIPQGISELEIVKRGEAGDMSYFYPDEPQYTIPARWFRYEMVNGFADNYSTSHANVTCMSELTLYGKKAE